MLMTLLAMGCHADLEPAAASTANDNQDCTWEASTNTWEQSTPPACQEAEGFEEGQVVPDIRLRDHHGDIVSLWQLHGDVILLDFTSMWGAQMWPDELADINAEYTEAGLPSVSAVFEDGTGDVPNGEALQSWAADIEAQWPVLADSADHVSEATTVTAGLCTFLSTENSESLKKSCTGTN